VRKRAAYEKPTSVRKRKAAAAVKRYRKKIEKETLQAKELRDRRKSAKNKAAASGPGNKNFRDKKSSDRYSRD
jgi:ribosomal protein S21